MLRHLITSGWLAVIPNGVRRQIELALAQTVDLQADEAARVRLVDRLVDDVFDRLTVDPRLNARTARDDPHLVPAVVDEVADVPPRSSAATSASSVPMRFAVEHARSPAALCR